MGEWKIKEAPEPKPEPVKPWYKTGRGAIALTVVAVIGIAGINGVRGLAERGRDYTPPPKTPAAVRVNNDVLEYHVTGTATAANVTYSSASGTVQNTVDVPMKNQSGGVGVIMKGAAIPTFAYISAQNDGASGSVTCKIVLNGTVVAENTSTGAYKIATCKA